MRLYSADFTADGPVRMALGADYGGAMFALKIGTDGDPSNMPIVIYVRKEHRAVAERAADAFNAAMAGQLAPIIDAAPHSIAAE